LLARTPPEVDEARLVLRDIARDEARAAGVIEHFRALLRQQAPVKTPVDITTLCRDTVKLLEPECIARHARLEVELDPTVPLVLGDPVQLQQALLNLAINALESIEMLPAQASLRELSIRTVANNGAVEIHVSDTGPGLSPDVQRQLFEPFFSTKPHGLGMGMTIVRTIVERHHGTIRAENRAEAGALFIVTLPAVGNVLGAAEMV
jgi:C4-dicarboxylate-specific signal transduction histidine kinase